MASCDAAASADAAAAMQKLMLIAADAATGASCGKAQNPKRLLLHCQTQRTQQERQASRGKEEDWVVVWKKGEQKRREPHKTNDVVAN